MARVLERSALQQKKAGAVRYDQKEMELEAAREILAEVFGIRLSDVDEMIQNRFIAADKRATRRGGLWPQELWVVG